MLGSQESSCAEVTVTAASACAGGVKLLTLCDASTFVARIHVVMYVIHWTCAVIIRAVAPSPAGPAIAGSVSKKLALLVRSNPG